MRIILFVASFLMFTSCTQHPDLTTALFRMGFKTDSASTGPLMCSGFIARPGENGPNLFITAHHVAASRGRAPYYNWNEIKDNVRNAWIWNMTDNNVLFRLGDNLPIPGASAAGLDVAAFHMDVPATTSVLTFAGSPAVVGDTVTLFTAITSKSGVRVRNPAVVVHVTDSVLVYHLLHYTGQQILSGSSGSPVLNAQNEVVANSHKGFIIPDAEEKEKLIAQLPLVAKLDVAYREVYGVGTPAALMVRALGGALEANKKN